MKYSLLADASREYRVPRAIKPDEVWGDMLLGTLLLVLSVAFFVYWFGARLRRASKGSQGP